MTVGILADQIIVALKQGLEDCSVCVKYYTIAGECRTAGEVVDLHFDEERAVVVLEIEEDILENVLTDATKRSEETDDGKSGAPEHDDLIKELEI